MRLTDYPTLPSKTWDGLAPAVAGTSAGTNLVTEGAVGSLIGGFLVAAFGFGLGSVFGMGLVR